MPKPHSRGRRQPQASAQIPCVGDSMSQADSQHRIERVKRLKALKATLPPEAWMAYLMQSVRAPQESTNWTERRT